MAANWTGHYTLITPPDVITSNGTTDRGKAMKIDIEGAYMNAEMTGEEIIIEADKMLTNIVKRYLPEVEPYVKDVELIVRLDNALYEVLDVFKEPFDIMFRKLMCVGVRKTESRACNCSSENSLMFDLRS